MGIADSIQKLVNSTVTRSILRQGYAVVDGAFPTELCQQFRREIMGLYSNDLMTLNCTHLVKNNQTKLLAKSNIFEAEMNFDARVQAASPQLLQLATDRTLATMLSLQLPGLVLDSQAMKVQYSAGAGACFPLHWDSDEQLDGRRITALLYLNPSWQSSDGGLLRLYPWPAPPRDVEPLEGRLVLFSSTRTLHRVKPALTAGRMCLTVWMSDTRKKRLFRAPPPSLSSLPKPTDMASAWSALVAHPKLYQAATKLAFKHEWYQSLVESHPDTPERAHMLEQFNHEVQVMEDALSDYIPYIQSMTEQPDVSLIRANPPSWLPTN